MVSILNDSNIMKVKKKKITFSSTSYLRMKSENALKFIKSIMTLSIATSPTWRTEHRRYIAERLRVLAALEEESVLSAMVTTHEMRHGTKVDVYSHPQWGYTFTESAGRCSYDARLRRRRSRRPTIGRTAR